MDGKLYRIINGYFYKTIGKNRLKIYYPNKEIIYEGNLIYEEVINGDGYSSSHIAKKTGLWSFVDEKELRASEEKIEGLKQQLYESFFYSQANSIRGELRSEKDKCYSLVNRKIALDAYSIESAAEYSRLAFFVEQCTFLKGKRYNWKRWSIKSGIYYWLENIIKEGEIRKISRGDTWQSIISSSKNLRTPVFQNCLDMNQDQVRLSCWTGIYNNIRQMDDSPHDDIFEDDDAFDGYLIFKKKERDKDSNKGNLDRALSNKVSSHEEIFLFPNERRDLQTTIDMVNESNGGHSNHLKESRLAAVKKGGTIKHGALPDVKQRVEMEANRAR